MRRLAACLAASFLANAAQAADCNVYTHRSRAPGETVAKLEDNGWRLRIEELYGEDTLYQLRPRGTGIPGRDGRVIEDTDEEEGPERYRPDAPHITVLEHQGDLIIDMMIFVPYCGPPQSEKTVRLPIIPNAKTAAATSP